MNSVICIDGKNCNLTTGKKYEHIKASYKGNFIRVKNDVGIILDYPARKFREATNGN